MIETDSIWFKNPMTNYFANRNLVEDADLVLSQNFCNEKGQEFFFSPMVVFATNASRRAIQEIRRIVNRDPNFIDQVILN